jgi:hypothetical protein
MFGAIADDAPFPWTAAGPRDVGLAQADRMEELAYDEVLRHARRVPAAELERHARRDVRFQDLVQKGRLAFKLDLVTFEGRLRLLRRVEPTDILKEGGIADVYEAWVFPRGEANPVCAFVTELPPGLGPQADLSAPPPDRWVSATGYYFKLLRYEARKADARGRNEVRRAPVLIGRTLRVLADPPAADGGLAWRQTFLPAAVAGFGAVAAVLVGLAWWFRRGDRAVRRRLAERAGRNPFAADSGIDQETQS